jgi:twitching motility protein PilT
MNKIDQATEKVVMHHNLCNEKQMIKAKKLAVKKKLLLVEVLIKTKLISEKAGKNVMAQVDKLMANQAAKASGTTVVKAPREISITTDQVRAMDLVKLLEFAAGQRASDLQIHVGFPPILRRNGVLHNLGDHIFTADETKRLLFDVLSEEQTEEAKKEFKLDYCLTFKGHGRYRSCLTKQRLGWDGSFHIVAKKIPTFEDLNLPDFLKRLTEHPQGLVLITGPLGSGKSSTLAAMIEHINVTRNEHIITLEEPVEYVFKPKKSHISQRQIPDDSHSYSNALRAALREDPDIIMIGELRDAETASLAISASETGHLVFTTLHTTSAAKTVNRLLDIFPPVEQLQIRSMVSQSLRGIVCQQLVPRQDGSGRELVQEIMFNIPAVGNLIRENRMLQLPSIMQTKSKMGMQLMDTRLKELIAEETIDEDEAYFAAENVKQFKRPEFLNIEEEGNY